MNGERVMLLLMPRPGQTGTGGQAVRTLLVADLQEAGCRVEFLDPEDARFHGLGRPLPGRVWQRLRFYLEVLRVARRHQATDVVFDLYHFQRLWPVPWLLKLLRPSARCHGIVQSPEKWVAGDEIEQRFAPWFFVGEGRRLRWNRRLGRWTARACHQVLAAGPWMRQFMIETVGVPARKVEAFGPGSGLVEAPASAAPRLHGGNGDTWQPADPAPIIGVGYVDPYKGVHRVIEALAMVEDQAVRVDWLGDDRHHNPAYADWCRGLVVQHGLGTRFRFLGRLNREQVDAHYRQASALVSAAPYEGYGLNHLEAVVNGLRIIGPKDSASAWFTDQPESDLYSPGNRAELAEVLRDVLASTAHHRPRMPDSAALPRLAHLLLRTR